MEKNEDKYKEQILIKEGNKQRFIDGGRKITDPEYELFLEIGLNQKGKKKPS